MHTFFSPVFTCVFFVSRDNDNDFLSLDSALWPHVNHPFISGNESFTHLVITKKKEKKQKNPVNIIVGVDNSYWPPGNKSCTVGREYLLCHNILVSLA